MKAPDSYIETVLDFLSHDHGLWFQQEVKNALRAVDLPDPPVATGKLTEEHIKYILDHWVSTELLQPAEAYLRSLAIPRASPFVQTQEWLAEWLYAFGDGWVDAGLKEVGSYCESKAVELFARFNQSQQPPTSPSSVPTVEELAQFLNGVYCGMCRVKYKDTLTYFNRMAVKLHARFSQSQQPPVAESQCVTPPAAPAYGRFSSLSLEPQEWDHPKDMQHLTEEKGQPANADDMDATIAELREKLAAAEKLAMADCDCCPMYEANWEALRKMLGLPSHPDGIPGDIYCIVEAIEKLLANQLPPADCEKIAADKIGKTAKAE